MGYFKIELTKKKTVSHLFNYDKDTELKTSNFLFKRIGQLVQYREYQKITVYKNRKIIFIYEIFIGTQ